MTRLTKTLLTSVVILAAPLLAGTAYSQEYQSDLLDLPVTYAAHATLSQDTRELKRVANNRPPIRFDSEEAPVTKFVLFEDKTPEANSYGVFEPFVGAKEVDWKQKIKRVEFLPNDQFANYGYDNTANQAAHMQLLDDTLQMSKKRIPVTILRIRWK